MYNTKKKSFSIKKKKSEEVEMWDKERRYRKTSLAPCCSGKRSLVTGSGYLDTQQETDGGKWPWLSQPPGVGQTRGPNIKTHQSEPVQLCVQSVLTEQGFLFFSPVRNDVQWIMVLSSIDGVNPWRCTEQLFLTLEYDTEHHLWETCPCHSECHLSEQWSSLLMVISLWLRASDHHRRWS